ncbi:MAG: DHH family phosphoesterase [Candidatus Aenigmarchaeota archaeon]|nr:DHH family phosphoesterase [Candidatus Aenigmarchaeota archaeon]
MFRQGLLEKALKFISLLENYSLVYHKDADGVCSAVLLSKVKNPTLSSPNDSNGIKISDSLMERLNELPKAVFTDLPVDQMPYERIKVKTLVIDHHIPTRDLNNYDNFIHLNPRFKMPNAYLPASYLVYRILEKKYKNIKKYSWIAGVGVVGDRGTNSCRDLIDVIERDYPELLIKDKYNPKKMWSSELGFFSKLIDSSKGVKGIRGIMKSYEIFLNAEKPEDIKNTELMNYYRRFQRELENLIMDFRYHSEFFPETNAYMYRIESKYNIESTLSTVLSEKNPDAAIFVYRIKNGLHISARCQTGRINVADVLRNLSEGIGSGGGHPQAAAASIRKEHANRFLERLRNYLEGMKG